MPSTRDRREAAREERRLYHSIGAPPLVISTFVLVLLHGGLLVASIPNYRVTIDSAYHVSMGRAYGEQGLVAWDRINFGPRGRPNLQGPFLHAALGGVGRLFGGHGDDYVLANAILAVVQWVAATGTVAFFAYKLSGEIAMLLAVALLSGAAFTGTSFAVGIPSGWLFIFTPWAIWFFLEERIANASVAAALAIYSHIGGYLTAPLGIGIAAFLTRRWRQLLISGAVTAGLTLPYTIHIIRYAGWFSGVKSHSALLFDPMLDALAIAGAVPFLFAPREHPFLVAWLLAPTAWLFQDPGRFFLQWPLAGAVAAGCLLANKIARIPEARRRIHYAIGLAAVATLVPFGLPSLGAEVSWAAGNHYPLAIDWRNAHYLAQSINRAGLSHSLVADYSPTLCPAIAVYIDITCEKGDWVEVQPRDDPAAHIGAAQKTYVIPVAPDDRLLEWLSSAGWVTVFRNRGVTTSSNHNSVVRLIHQPSVGQAATFASATISSDAAWLGHNVINNAIAVTDLLRTSSVSGREQFQHMLAIQRARVGHIELACLVYAWALEERDLQDALEMRQIALQIGVITSYLSDDFALDFLGRGAMAGLREQFLELASSSNRLAFDPVLSPKLIAIFNSLVYAGLKSRGSVFAGRPAGDWLPWLCR